MRYKSATALMDRLEPFIALYTSEGDAAGTRKVRTVGAVAAMNHLKRLERAGLSSAEQQRLERQFRAFAALAEAGIDTLHGKHISLALNAVGHRPGYVPLFAAAAPRLRALCRRCLSCSDHPQHSGTARARDAGAEAGAAAAEGGGGGSEAVGGGGAAGEGVCGWCPLDGRSVALSLNALSKSGFRDAGLLADLTAVVVRLAEADSLEVPPLPPRRAAPPWCRRAVKRDAGAAGARAARAQGMSRAGADGGWCSALALDMM